MKQLIIRLLILILCITVYSHSSAQNRKQRRTSENSKLKASAKTIIVYDNKPFDLMNERLPSNYLGHDIVGLFSPILKRTGNLTRGEFETTSMFQERVKNALKNPIISQLGFKDLFAISLPEENTEKSYDADNQVMTVKIKTDFPYELSNFTKDNDSLNKESINLYYRLEKKIPYIAKNIFGRPLKATATKWHTFGVIFKNGAEFSKNGHYYSSLNRIPALIKMDIPTAQRAKRNLRVLFVSSLTSPFASYGNSHSTPTVLEPIDELNSYYYVNIKIKEIWFYDFVNGEVHGILRPIPKSLPKEEAKIEIQSQSSASPTPTPIQEPNIPKIVSGGVLNNKATNLVKPPYPVAAKAVNAEGAVNIQVTTDENGNVVSAYATSGHPLLRAAALQAARSSKFSPTIIEGKPVKVTGVIVYNFTAR